MRGCPTQGEQPICSHHGFHPVPAQEKHYSHQFLELNLKKRCSKRERVFPVKPCITLLKFNWSERANNRLCCATLNQTCRFRSQATATIDPLRIALPGGYILTAHTVHQVDAYPSPLRGRRLRGTGPLISGNSTPNTGHLFISSHKCQFQECL